MDIPRVDDIPVVSKLAKEKKDVQYQPKVDQFKNKREKVTKMIEAEEDEFESHFVENPFIKLREKAATKTLHGKTHLGAADFDVNEDEQDIIMIKESGKFVI